MKFIETFPKMASDYIARWHVVLWFALTACVLFIGGLRTDQISASLFILFVARLLAKDLLTKAIREKSASHRSPKITVANPRVWTIHIGVSKTFIEEALRQSAPTETGIWINETLVKRITIEEFPDRIRQHVWFIKDSRLKYDELLSDSDHLSYEWTDRGMTDYPAVQQLWPFASAARDINLLLVGSWEWDPVKRRVFFQISLTIERTDELGHRLKIDAADVVFSIPLDPGLLGDRTGRLVKDDNFVERKASEVEPYPMNEDGWRDELKLKEERRWHWSVDMRTFQATGIEFQ